MAFDYLSAGPELPLVVALLVAMLLVLEGGYRIGGRAAARASTGTTSVVPAMVTATLALLALLVGFSLTMAVSRYDARRQLVLAEANAIGTAHLRARLLPPPEGPELAIQLRRYLDLRLAVVERPPHRGATAAARGQAEALQAEMLATAIRLVRTEPSPEPAEPFVEALKELIDVHERRVSAFESFVPNAVLYLLGLAALGGALVMGYGCGVHGRRNGLATTVYAVLICLAILVIVDLDRPVHGLIRVSQRSLERLQAQLAAAPDPGPPADPFAGARAVRYRCADGRDVRARFRADPPMALIERDGARWVLPLQRSGSGARYGDGTVTFWEHQGEARLEREGRAVACRRGT
jgi:membrane-bound inhibitor of C-type lysozyme